MEAHAGGQPPGGVTPAVAADSPVLVSTKNTPPLTVPQWLALSAFVIFAVLAFFADAKPGSNVTEAEFSEVRDLTLFLIAALLPSDALIRYGRGILFRTVGDAEKAAADAPASTRAQKLAFTAFVVVVVLTLFSDTIVSAAEFDQVNDVLRALILALLPSDAAVRFGRSLSLRGAAQLTPAQAQRI